MVSSRGETESQSEETDFQSRICPGPSYSSIPGYPDQHCYQRIDDIKSDPENWQPLGYKAKSCHSERVEPRCSLYASLPIFYAISGCNLVKLLIMLFVAFGLREAPLITIGDAVASFLDSPDSTTQNLCLLSKKAVTTKKIWEPNRAFIQPLAAQEECYRWSSAVSTRRWVLGTIILLVPFSTVVGLFVFTWIRTNSSVPPLSTGFGRTHGAALVLGIGSPEDISNESQRILASAIIANAPQLLFSFITFTLNGILTTICLAQEWNHFSDPRQRKPLRVSSPRGEQRSTYFLQLPYRLGLPFTIISGVLHWFISQSIFLSVVASYTPWGWLDSRVYVATCGYSSLAMLMVILTGILIFAGIATFRFLNYTTIMPLVGSCSAAISAACHDSGKDCEVSIKPVQWGAVPNSGEADVGHCCFTSGHVERPVAGQLYAGFKKTHVCKNLGAI